MQKKPLILALLAVRIVIAGHWPERLRPSVFILVAPPAVIGLGLLQFEAPIGVAWGLWGVALFSAAWAATQLPRIATQPFGLSHWAMSFPLAALAALTLRLAPPSGAMAVLALALLAGLGGQQAQENPPQPVVGPQTAAASSKPEGRERTPRGRR